MHVGPGQIGDPGQVLTGSKACASDEPPPPVTAGHAFGPIIGDGLDLARIQRQQPPSFFSSVMLSSAPSSATRDRRPNTSSRRDRTAGGRGSHSAARCARAAALVVDGRFLHRSSLDRSQQALAFMKRGARHLQIEPVVGRAHRFVGRVPVRHQDALKSPLALQHLEIEELILRGVRRR
jgi:hypothetical protein